MIIHHSVRVKASADDIYPMLLDWGAGAWWPENSRIHSTRPADGVTEVGSRFTCRMDAPSVFGWTAEVVSASAGREVSRQLSGALTGVERLYIISGRVACEVHVLMDFEVAGGLARFLWRVWLAKRHEADISEALSALRGKLEGAEGGKVEEYPASGVEAERRRFLKGLIRR